MLDLHYRAHHIFLNVHYMLFMLCWAFKGNWGIAPCASTLLQKFYIPLALPSVFLLSAKQLSFSTVQDCLRGLEMYCTTEFNNTCKDIQSVQKCAAHTQYHLLYIYTHLLNVPFYQRRSWMLKDTDRQHLARTQISDVGVLNASFRLNMEIQGQFYVQYEGVQVLFASGSFSYRVLKCIFLCSVLSSV